MPGDAPVRWVWQQLLASIPGKNLGACGEAGAITTDDEAMAKTHEDDPRPRSSQEVLPRYRGLQRPLGLNSSWLALGQTSPFDQVE